MNKSLIIFDVIISNGSGFYTPEKFWCYLKKRHLIQIPLLVINKNKPGREMRLPVDSLFLCNKCVL